MKVIAVKTTKREPTFYKALKMKADGENKY